MNPQHLSLIHIFYEFSTYIGNDMIQPGMLAVVEQYQAGIDWVPTSMTAYLAVSYTHLNR